MDAEANHELATKDGTPNDKMTGLTCTTPTSQCWRTTAHRFHIVNTHCSDTLVTSLLTPCCCILQQRAGLLLFFTCFSVSPLRSST